MVDTYRIGAQGSDTLAGRIIKYPSDSGASLAATAGRALQLNGANYQVTAGKSFYVTGILLHGQVNGAANGTVYLLYADNAAMTTNPVPIGWTYPARGSADPARTFILPFFFTVPATKFLGLYNFGGVNDFPGPMQIIGYEA